MALKDHQQNFRKKNSKHTHRIQMLSSEEYLGIINHNSLEILTQCSTEVKRKTNHRKSKIKKIKKKTLCHCLKFLHILTTVCKFWCPHFKKHTSIRKDKEKRKRF